MHGLVLLLNKSYFHPLQEPVFPHLLHINEENNLVQILKSDGT